MRRFKRLLAHRPSSEEGEALRQRFPHLTDERIRLLADALAAGQDDFSLPELEQLLEWADNTVKDAAIVNAIFEGEVACSLNGDGLEIAVRSEGENDAP